MRYLGQSKIGKLHPKRSYVYPMIRLPKECLDAVGETAYLYSLETEGRRGFLIALEKEANEVQNVAQPVLKVAQTQTRNDADSRLSALELELKALKLFLFDYKAKKVTQFKKERKSKAEGEIRTRVVASTGP